MNIGSWTNSPVSLKVNDSEIARITSTGLGIGTTDPKANLHSTGSTILGAASVSWANIGNNQMHLYCDEGNGKFYIVFKKSDGTTIYTSLQLA